MPVGLSDAIVARMSLTGELGYELTVPAGQHRTLFHDLMRAGEPYGIRPFGMRALDSLRLEKGYGSWSTEFAQNITPAMCGLHHHVAVDKGQFVGRDAYVASQGEEPSQRLVLLRVDTTDADAVGFEPVFLGDRRVGYVTSGGYGHWVGASLALAYIDTDALGQSAEFEIDIIGDHCRATVLPESPYDPSGSLLRS
jgi:dimethylglycine dehydrogenase